MSGQDYEFFLTWLRDNDPAAFTRFVAEKERDNDDAD